MEMVAHKGIGQYVHAHGLGGNRNIDQRDSAVDVILEDHSRLQGFRMEMPERPFLPEHPLQLPVLPHLRFSGHLLHGHKHT